MVSNNKAKKINKKIEHARAQLGPNISPTFCSKYFGSGFVEFIEGGVGAMDLDLVSEAREISNERALEIVTLANQVRTMYFEQKDRLKDETRIEKIDLKQPIIIEGVSIHTIYSTLNSSDFNKSMSRRNGLSSRDNSTLDLTSRVVNLYPDYKIFSEIRNVYGAFAGVERGLFFEIFQNLVNHIEESNLSRIKHDLTVFANNGLNKSDPTNYLYTGNLSRGGSNGLVLERGNDGEMIVTQINSRSVRSGYQSPSLE